MKLFGTRKNAAHYTKKKRGRARKVLTVLIVLAVVTTGSIYAMMTIYVKPPEVAAYVPKETEAPEPAVEALAQVEEEPEPEETVEPVLDENRPSGIYTVLIVGQDEGGGNTDTMILCAIDSINGGINMVSIPRDTMVDVSWSPRKVNSVLGVTGEVDSLMEEVEAITGFMPDNYVIVDLDAFVALVDAIGGVYFDVPLDMKYSDPYQNLNISLSAGYQHLDGEQAIGVVRWRQNNDGTGYINGDIGRIETQQAFLKAVAKELLQIQNVTKVTELADIFVEYVETDLPMNNLIWYATQLMGMDSEDINFITLPGDYDAMVDGYSYVIIDVEEWLAVVNEYLNPYPDDVEEENIHVYTWVDGVLDTVGDGLALTP